VNINYSKTVDVTDASGAITEPVTLQEMKDYLRMEGFVDDDESTSTALESFDFDDTLLEEMITMAREQYEETLAVSLIPKTLKSIIWNPCGMIEIPYGPVSSVTTFQDIDDNDLDYTLSGELGDFVNIKTPCGQEMVVTYEAGYGNTDCPEVPKSVKLDIMRLVTHLYENRGNSSGFISRVSKKYSRKTWLA
jgi:hypothetical protein